MKNNSTGGESLVDKLERAVIKSPGILAEGIGEIMRLAGQLVSTVLPGRDDSTPSGSSGTDSSSSQ